jgi:hypothetical protein
MKSGYLYVLTHPSNSCLYKIGQTIRHPKKRLVEHNSNYEEYTGKVVKDTGQKWEIKTYIEAPNPYYAETVFWNSMPLADIPFLNGIEVQNMEWEWVQLGLDAAKKAGIRPTPKSRTTPVKNREWLVKRLENTEVSLVGQYRGLVTGVDFECINGHIFKPSPGVVANRKSCPLCDMEKE